MIYNRNRLFGLFQAMFWHFFVVPDPEFVLFFTCTDLCVFMKQANNDGRFWRRSKFQKAFWLANGKKFVWSLKLDQLLFLFCFLFSCFWPSTRFRFLFLTRFLIRHLNLSANCVQLFRKFNQIKVSFQLEKQTCIRGKTKATVFPWKENCGKFKYFQSKINFIKI